MNTGALASFIQRRAPDWSTIEIIELINDAQNMILANNLYFNRALDTSTGTYPVLTTTAGVKFYELNTANVGVDFQYVSAVSTGDMSSPAEGVTYRQMSGTTMASVLFKDDPGSSTYYVDGYTRPAQVTSKSTPLTLPERWHIRGIAELVIGMIELAEHGKSDRYDAFFARTLSDIHYDLNTNTDNLVILVDGVDC